MKNYMSFSYDSKPIQTVVNNIKNSTKRDGIDLKPKYQRGYIWANDFRDKLIYSIIFGYPIGNISLRIRENVNGNGSINEVVDGQQRLTTIFNFFTDIHEVKGICAKNIIDYILVYCEGEEDTDGTIKKLKKHAESKSGWKLKYSQLPELIKENINAYNISITNITNADDEAITEYFRYLQNQEVLRAGEIINSIPDNILENYFTKIENLDVFFKKVSFSSPRKQFDKLFYGILGLLDGKINFGIQDKLILDYVSECKGLSCETEIMCNNMIDSINYITEYAKDNMMNSNVRCMKFFLLLSSLNLVDFKEDTNSKLSRLNAINKQLSSFSSAKPNIINETFNGFSQDVIEEYRLLALISKGSHKLDRVRNRMQILAYYINNENCIVTSSSIEAI